ncbi:MAG: acylneuraminate cytidylyltransferase family protein [Clostridiales bacterium]|nr:acylneuraminate cytidylyltransferase family protein [Clostridiales bacterium]
MIADKRVLALIPARGGSKGIKGKNIIDVCGKPLLAYSIEAAAESQYMDAVVVSTDSVEIADTAEKWGAEVPFLRPAEYASDTAKSIDAVLHAVRELKRQGREYDILVLLQPTQPLRTAQDIDRALECFLKHQMEGLVSVCEVEEHPILMRTIGEDGRLDRVLSCGSTVRRQDMPAFYKVNGCIYINAVKELSEATSFNDNPVPYVMEKERSIDIDSYEDLERLRRQLREKK